MPPSLPPLTNFPYASHCIYSNCRMHISNIKVHSMLHILTYLTHSHSFCFQTFSSVHLVSHWNWFSSPCFIVWLFMLLCSTLHSRELPSCFRWGFWPHSAYNSVFENNIILPCTFFWVKCGLSSILAFD
jgi:hypothetical protein